MSSFLFCLEFIMVGLYDLGHVKPALPITLTDTTSVKDWAMTMTELSQRLTEAFDDDVIDTRFTVNDTVGIYAMGGKIAFRLQLSARRANHPRQALLSFKVEPIAVYPKSLVRETCNTPGSYSEMAHEFGHLMGRLLREHRPVIGLGWSLPRIFAERVALDKPYTMALRFDWGDLWTGRKPD